MKVLKKDKNKRFKTWRWKAYWDVWRKKCNGFTYKSWRRMQLHLCTRAFTRLPRLSPLTLSCSHMCRSASTRGGTPPRYPPTPLTTHLWRVTCSWLQLNSFRNSISLRVARLYTEPLLSLYHSDKCSLIAQIISIDNSQSIIFFLLRKIKRKIYFQKFRVEFQIADNLNRNISKTIELTKKI